jgi:murein DD-endopeptidase MepM/ murein hydrolase activator NlpD
MAQRHGYANFGAFAAEEKRRDREKGVKSSDAQPQRQESRMHQLHRLLGISWYYGGWMEDRSEVWAETYLKETGNFLHLGIDCSVPAKTEVLVLADGPILWSSTDEPIKGGWGGHVVQRIHFRGKPHALIYAHLGTRQAHRGMYLRKGDAIGYVGTWAENGQWGEHLHLQLDSGVDEVDDWEKYLDHGIDGYGKVADLTYWAERCPDPTCLIFS